MGVYFIGEYCFDGRVDVECCCCCGILLDCCWCGFGLIGCVIWDIGGDVGCVVDFDDEGCVGCVFVCDDDVL